MLTSCDQKVSSQAQWAILSPAVDVVLPAKRQNLPYSGTHAERSKPVTLPLGKASRKVSRWSCRYGITEKANAIL